jgi:CRISPR-associated protein Cas2
MVVAERHITGNTYWEDSGNCRTPAIALEVMIILIVSKAKPSLRGRLTRWLLQLKAGVYVGTISARVRDELWKSTCDSLRNGWAVLLYAAKREQGFDLRMHGNAPFEFEDFEGLWMAKTRKKP